MVYRNQLCFFIYLYYEHKVENVTLMNISGKLRIVFILLLSLCMPMSKNILTSAVSWEYMYIIIAYSMYSISLCISIDTE